MKQKTSLRLFVSVIALLCIGVFVLAVVWSSTFTAAVGPRLTQQAVSRRLYQASEQSKVTTKASPSVRKSSPSVSAATRPAATNYTAGGSPKTSLVNTGPSNAIAVFCIASVIGTLLAYVTKLTKLHR